MARLYQQKTVKPIPTGARIVTVRGDRVASWKNAEGRERHAFVNDAGDRIVIFSKKWYGEWQDADGNKCREPLAVNKEAARILLADKVREAEQIQNGSLIPKAVEKNKRPLADSLKDFEAVLTARGDGENEQHVRQIVGYARAVLDGCGFVNAADLTAGPVEEFIASLRKGVPMAPLDPAKDSYTKADLATAVGVKLHCIQPLLKRHRLEGKGNGKARRYSRETAEALRDILTDRGVSIETANRYLLAIKQFATWLVDNDRLDRNPFARIKRGNIKLDRRHDRRALPAQELQQVLDAALASPVTFRGLTGPDRHHVYLTAMTTGYRAEELSNLTPKSFDLDGDPPTATLSARNTKNENTTTQPLPLDIAAALRKYLAGKPAGQQLWPGTWFKRAADMLRIELDACGIPYEVPGPDGPLYADFHALRHSYIALLDKTGATVKEAMQLARHSDPKLTMAVYGKARLHDLGATVERLPLKLASQDAPRATGTEG